MRTLSIDEISEFVDSPSANAEPIQLSIQAGLQVYRVIHNIKQITPSRFGAGEDDDYTGWIWLGGKRVAVETAYWGDVLIWRLSDDDEGATT